MHFWNTTELAALSWPPRSPDLTPIDHIWDVAEQDIYIMDFQTQICNNCVMLLCQHRPKSLKNISSSLLD